MTENETCTICGKMISTKGNALHNHYIDDLEEYCHRSGNITVREGKMFGFYGWREPDLFVFSKDMKLKIVLDVIVSEGRKEMKKKAQKINRWLQSNSISAKIVFFEPYEYVDKRFLSNDLDYFRRKFGRTPKSYREASQWTQEIWSREGLEVTFVGESDIRGILQGAVNIK